MKGFHRAVSFAAALVLLLTACFTAPVYSVDDDYFPRCGAWHFSIVDALTSIGVDSSYEYRTLIAEANGFTPYVGSASQNIAMLNLLKQGLLRRPASEKTTDSSSANFETFPACADYYDSIVDALNSIGVDSSFSYRQKIALVNGFTDYSGRSDENLTLLGRLKNGTLLNPDVVKKTDSNSGQTRHEVVPSADPEHDHDFTFPNSEDECDICKVCGYLRIHKTDDPLPFRTLNDSVKTYALPQRSDSCTSEIRGQYSEITVVGRIRNQDDELWLELSNNLFVCVDDVAFDIDKYFVILFHTFYTDRLLLTFPSFFKSTPKLISLFRPDGPYDFKKLSLLGSKEKYSIYTKGETYYNYLSGADIGNFFFGYACACAGIGLELTVKLGYLGVGIFPSDKDIKVPEALQCFGDYKLCDDPDDLVSIEKGWHAFYAILNNKKAAL